MSAAEGYAGVLRVLTADEPVCECGHIHAVHDTYGDGPPDAFGEPTVTLECSRCECAAMSPVPLTEPDLVAEVEAINRHFEAEDLLVELSRKMAEAAAEFRRPTTVEVNGARVWGEWPEAT